MNSELCLKQNELLNQISAFSEDTQDALVWLINNYDSLSAICKVKPLTEEQRNDYIYRAQTTNDTCMLLLILLERSINR